MLNSISGDLDIKPIRASIRGKIGRFIAVVLATVILSSCSTVNDLVPDAVSDLLPGKNEEEIIALFVHKPGKKLLLASIAGRGFMLDSDNVIASTKNGRKIMNVEEGKNKIAVCMVIDENHDNIAIIGTNRKMLVFPLDQMPQMNKGRGAVLQKYKGAHMGDITSFNGEDGLSWPMKGGKTRTETDLTTWIGRRGAVGRMPPHGFPTTNRFS